MLQAKWFRFRTSGKTLEQVPDPDLAEEIHEAAVIFLQVAPGQSYADPTGNPGHRIQCGRSFPSDPGGGGTGLWRVYLEMNKSTELSPAGRVLFAAIFPVNPPTNAENVSAIDY